MIQRRLLTNRIRSLAILLCVLATLTENATALDPSRSIRRYRLDTWTTEQGLPHNSISSIIQTTDGFLWIATLRGVVRFDGIQFQEVHIPTSISTRCRNFVSLLQTPDGSVWVATEGAGLLRVMDDSLQLFDPTHGFPDDHIQCLALDSTGGLWIGTWSGGIVRLVPPYSINSAERFNTLNGLPSDRIRDICAGNANDAWTTTLSGDLVHITPGRKPALSIERPTLKGPFYYLLRRTDGSLCVSTTEGLYAIQESSIVEELPSPIPRSDFFVSMLEDRDGNLWCGSYLSGLTRRTSTAYGRSLSSLTRSDGLAGNYVSSLCEDSEGSLWIGTEVGLNRLSDGSFITLSGDDGFTDDGIATIVQTPDGTIWGGSDGAGLLEVRNGMVTKRFGEKEGLHDPFVTAATVSNLGTLLFSTGNGSVYELKNGKKLSRLFTSAHTITALIQTRDYSLWCATTAGIERYSSPGSVRLPSLFDGHEANGTCLATIDGALWAGTHDGLYFADGTAFREFHTSDGLPSEYITCLKADSAGVLWIGTPEGIARFIAGHIERFDSRQGLVDRYVTSIVPDGRGFLWFGTLSGVYRIARTDFDSVARGAWLSVRPLAFMETDGMMSSECAEGDNVSLFDRTTGKIWFSTTRGLAIVNPAKLRFHPVLGQLRVQGITLPGGREYARPPYDFLAGDNNFAVHYTLPAFLIQNHLRFQYRLEEFDQAWVDAGTRRHAYYTNVPPGTYTFAVRAYSDLPGSVPIVKTSVDITVAPHFYERRIFYLGLGVLAIASLLVSHFIRVRRADQREQSLARVVEQRTRALLKEIAERKRAETALRESESHRQAILQVMPLVLYTARTPDQFGATWITENAEAVTGFPAERFLHEAHFWTSRIHPEDRKKVDLFLSMLRSGSAGDVEYRWECADGTYHWFLDHAVRFQESADGRLDYSGVWFDITDKMDAEEQLRVSLSEKEALLREVHHRVKNNLTIITSLLNLQASTVEEKATRDVLREAEGRVRSMATLHEHLYKADYLGAVDLKSYIISLVRSLSRTYSRPGVNIVTQIEGVTLEIALAIPCGLIVNELVTNAIKYAFPAEGKGMIVVSLTKEQDSPYVLEVRDDGKGFIPPPDLEESPTLGLKLVSILARQLGGTASFTSDHGTTCTVRFSGSLASAKAGIEPRLD